MKQFVYHQANVIVHQKASLKCICISRVGVKKQSDIDRLSCLASQDFTIVYFESIYK